MVIPTVIIKDNGQERAYDIFSLLLKKRIIMINGSVNGDLATVVIPQLLYLNSVDSKADIHVYVNSGGGSVEQGLAITDTMDTISNDIVTYCSGGCASMGAAILAAGTKGKRYAMPNSTVMIHSVSSGCRGTVQDMTVSYDETMRINELMMSMMAKNCGKTLAQMKKDCERDNYMTAEQAKAYGLVDHVVKPHKQ